MLLCGSAGEMMGSTEVLSMETESAFIHVVRWSQSFITMSHTWDKSGFIDENESGKNSGEKNTASVHSLSLEA